MFKRIHKTLKVIWTQRQLRKAQLSQAISHTRETIEDMQDDLILFKENFVAIHYNEEMGIFIGKLLLELSLFPLIKSYLKTPNSTSQEESTDYQCLESEECEIEATKGWPFPQLSKENIILAVMFRTTSHTILVMKLIFNYVCCCYAVTRAIRVRLTTVQATEVAETAFNIETNRYELEPAPENTEGAEVRFQTTEAKVSEEELEEAPEDIEENESIVSVAEEKHNEEELLEASASFTDATTPEL